ncbi:MAG: hypothetical protein HW401_64 [Parcubacteria group bacterium]|nr:hypothetical protein [Parcubacteria group bacterium]
MNTSRNTKKPTSKKLKNFRFFSKNLPPTTYHLKPIDSPLKPTTYNLQPSNKGFTLVELLVTLSLFVVLTTIVLFSQSKFNGSILLTNLAYDVAITVRQAQTYGVNVRETSSGDFDKAYGVYFDIDKDNNKFILFSDKQGNGRYQGNIDCKSSADTCVNSYSIKRGNYISDIRVTSPDCSPDPDCSVKELNITFARPDPDAKFAKTKSTSGDVDDITEAKIIISSANGDTRNVLVNSTGQISIGRGTGIAVVTFYKPYSNGNCTNYCASIGASCVSENPWSSGICPQYVYGVNKGGDSGANTTWCHTDKDEWGNPGGDLTSCNSDVTSGPSDRRIICGCQN